MYIWLFIKCLQHEQSLLLQGSKPTRIWLSTCLTIIYQSISFSLLSRLHPSFINIILSVWNLHTCVFVTYCYRPPGKIDIYTVIWISYIDIVYKVLHWWSGSPCWKSFNFWEVSQPLDSLLETIDVNSPYTIRKVLWLLALYNTL